MDTAHANSCTSTRLYFGPTKSLQMNGLRLSCLISRSSVLATIKLYRETNEKGLLGRHEILLEMHYNEIGSATHPMFRQEIGNVEFNSSFGNIELAGNLFVRQIEHE